MEAEKTIYECTLFVRHVRNIMNDVRV